VCGGGKEIILEVENSRRIEFWLRSVEEATYAFLEILKGA
jgi:hypothetical protein